MRMWRRCVSLLLTCAILFTVCGCSGGRKNKDKKLIAEKVAQFEECFHSVDINGMMDCIDPADVAGLQVVLLGASLITGKDSEELSDIAAQGLYYVIGTLVQKGADLPEFDTEEALVDCLRTVSIRADEISFPSRRDNDEALANCVVKIDVGVKVIQTRAELKMVKSKGEWYIDIQ